MSSPLSADSPYPNADALLRGNQQWAQSLTRTSYRDERIAGHTPRVLYFGCVDCRVPESVATGTNPGDILTYRNIANMFSEEDISALSVLHNALTVTDEVTDIVLAGHTDCDGIAEALRVVQAGEHMTPPYGDAKAAGDPPCTPYHGWLGPLFILTRNEHTKNTDLTASEVERLNVRWQVDAINSNEFVRKARQTRQVTVHGWLYDGHSGTFEVVVTKGNGATDRAVV